MAGFAARVKLWLDKQDNPGYRLNFFIDEVGQFIANKTRLMLQLQTITETLCTVCGGRVWVFVTSQEDLNSVVGDPDQVQVYDITKIHARFNYRISLSSANVEEVIQKRLLEKKGSCPPASWRAVYEGKADIQDPFQLQGRMERGTFQGQGAVCKLLSFSGIPVPAASGGADRAIPA